MQNVNNNQQNLLENKTKNGKNPNTFSQKPILKNRPNFSLVQVFNILLDYNC